MLCRLLGGSQGQYGRGVSAESRTLKYLKYRKAEAPLFRSAIQMCCSEAIQISEVKKFLPFFMVCDWLFTVARHI